MPIAIAISNITNVLINDPDYGNKNKKYLISIDNVKKIDYFYINQTFIIMISLFYIKQLRSCVPQDDDDENSAKPPGK
jgi:hypothetical protein